jgi:hypothetical protein
MDGVLARDRSVECNRKRFRGSAAGISANLKDSGQTSNNLPTIAAFGPSRCSAGSPRLSGDLSSDS